MDTVVFGFIMIGVLIVLLALGVHVALALAVVGFTGMIGVIGFEPALSSTTSTLYYRIADYKLVTVPLFVIMGLLAASGGMSAKLYDAAHLWLGRFRSGIGAATVMACTAFGTVSGSSLVTASVFAKISAPEMRSHGYDKRLAYGICASSGIIGMLVPPSILIVLYGIVSGESIGKLLIGGMIPGVILGIYYAFGLVVIGRIRPNWMRVPVVPASITWRRRFGSLIPTWPVLVVALIIFGGMFGGIFNPTEAGSVAAFVMLILVFMARRRQAFGDIAGALGETAIISAMIFFILAGASVFSHFLTLAGVTASITNSILGLNLTGLPLIIIIALTYIAMGCLLDGVSMVCITVPLFHPIIVSLGIDPTWYALCIIVAMEIGLITPPVGLNVYATQAVAEADVNIEDVFAGSIPFFFLALGTLALLLAFPILSTFLPNLMIPVG